jgi:hypothetical protein
MNERGEDYTSPLSLLSHKTIMAMISRDNVKHLPF